MLIACIDISPDLRKRLKNDIRGGAGGNSSGEGTTELRACRALNDVDFPIYVRWRSNADKFGSFFPSAAASAHVFEWQFNFRFVSEQCFVLACDNGIKACYKFSM